MADLEGNQLPGANRGSFLTFPMGFVLGLFTAVFGSFLMEEAHGQEPQSVLVEDAARVSGDWGIQRVQAVPGQRIPVRLSLQEINRISFEDDEAFNVRVAENNVPGAPIIQFERDNRTGDMYATIANGAAGQVLSAFVTTDRGHTYHLLFTIENQPATQIIIAGPTANDQFELSSSDSSAPYQQRIVEFATFALQEQGISSQERVRPIEISEDVVLLSMGHVEGGAFVGQVFSLQNRSNQTFPINHQAFLADGILAVVSAEDTVPPATSVRLVMIEREE